MHGAECGAIKCEEVIKYQFKVSVGVIVYIPKSTVATETIILKIPHSLTVIEKSSWEILPFQLAFSSIYMSLFVLIPCCYYFYDYEI